MKKYYYPTTSNGVSCTKVCPIRNYAIGSLSCKRCPFCITAGSDNPNAELSNRKGWIQCEYINNDEYIDSFDINLSDLV